MIRQNELIGYALDFASHLVTIMAKLESIILFGSAARGDYDHESDIDFFIHTKEKNIYKKIKNAIDNYYLTERYKRWKLKGISNTFSCITGDLDSEEWEELRRGIINTGFILYGRYAGKVEELKHHSLFSLNPVKPESKRVVVHKKLFGFRVKEKKYEGLLAKYKGAALGKGVFIVPVEYSLNIKKYLQKEKISFRVYDVWKE